MNIRNTTTVTQLAEKLGVSRARVHQLLRIYNVKAEKIGNMFLISNREARKIPDDRPVGIKIHER